MGQPIVAVRKCLLRFGRWGNPTVPDGVTVRDLLQHTSGIPNYTESRTFLASVSDDLARAWSPEETMAMIEGVNPNFAPGEAFSYSNTNYLILGVLIEELTGGSYAEALRARITEPLQLNDTYLAGFEDGAAPFGAYGSPTFIGRPEAIDSDYTSIATNAWAAGAIVSSAGDLHRLFRGLFGGEMLVPDSLSAMTTNEEYGLGLILFDDGLYGHNGGIPGYQTFVAHAADTGTTVFYVVTNDSVRTAPDVQPLLSRIQQD